MDSPDYLVGVAQQALWVLALACVPILIPALIAGLILGMFQAATSINEQTLTFVPKLIVVAICLAIFGGSIMMLIAVFAKDNRYSADYIANYANVYVLDALRRVPGAGQAAVLGAGIGITFAVLNRLLRGSRKA